MKRLRDAVGAKSGVWKRPEAWERLPGSYLHPSAAERIAELEQALQEAQAALDDANALVAKQLMYDRALDDACKELLSDAGADGAGAGKAAADGGPRELHVTVHDEEGSKIGRGSVTAEDGAGAVAVEFAEGDEAKGGKKASAVGAGPKLQWKDGSVWSRDPHDVTGPWFDERGERRQIDPVGAGTDGKLKALDDACREVGRGAVGARPDGTDEVKMAFADGTEDCAAVSPDGQQLSWAGRPGWTRVPGTVAGRWYDEHNQPKLVEVGDAKDGLLLSEDGGKPLGKGELTSTSPGQKQLQAKMADGTARSAPLSAD